MPETMKQLGDRIRTCVEKGDNMLASAARCAAEARKRYTAGENDGFETWGQWWTHRTGLSDRRGRQLLQIGRADNPAEAADEHKEKNRAAVAKHRAAKAELRNSVPADESDDPGEVPSLEEMTRQADDWESARGAAIAAITEIMRQHVCKHGAGLILQHAEHLKLYERDLLAAVLSTVDREHNSVEPSAKPDERALAVSIDEQAPPAATVPEPGASTLPEPGAAFAAYRKRKREQRRTDELMA